jgi:hypothetical protein
MSHPQQPRDERGHFIPAGQQQPPKKKGGCLKYLAIAAGLVVLLIILAAACGGGGSSTNTGSELPENPPASAPAEQGTPTPEPDPAPTEDAESTRTLTMTATSTSTGNSTVSWYDLDGSMNSKNFVGEWTMEIPLEDTAARYSMSVTPDFMDTTAATVTCSMSIDGETVDEATATGDSLASASCSQPLF